MGVLDIPLQGVVQSILASVGSTCLLRQITRGQYDPLSGLRSPPATVEWQVLCSPDYEHKKSLVDGSSVKQDDFKIILATAGATVTPADADPNVVPDVHMVLVRAGKEFSIVDVTPINSGDLNVAYELHCRG